MATPEEVLAVTGYEIVTLGPLGLLEDKQILADQSVLTPAEISIGSGIRSTAVILKPNVQMDALGHPETGIFSD